MGEQQWGLAPASRQQQGMLPSCVLVMGMSARSVLSDPVLGGRGTGLPRLRTTAALSTFR